ncbi:SDR family NAD(P)-dependent oxidoreductase [Pararhizobium sp. PWRC1-1]|uniref:SDR family NAD(P)-dependent oxidoreductase n=1 Tax=Pararhizobium sp. PWRC1-1 TaxID=2804566 RepID=UPI003CE685D7
MSCFQLAEAGVHVIIGAWGDERGRAAVDDLASQHLIAQSVRLDPMTSRVLKPPQPRSEHGKLDILVNNAGMFDVADAPPSSASIEAVRRVMDINFIGSLRHAGDGALVEGGSRCRIVNLSSSHAEWRSHLNLLFAAVH